MIKQRVLLIEDDVDHAAMVRELLTVEGFESFWAGDVDVGVQEAIRTKPDLILLDLNLPSGSGHDVCRNLKSFRETSSIPLMFVTGRIEESDVVLALGLGADDYVTKPFRPRELVARIRAALRRGEERGPGRGAGRVRIEHGMIALDCEKHEVRLAGRKVPLTAAEFTLLWTLACSPSRVFSRDEILDQINHGEAHVVDRVIDVHVRAVRKKLGTFSGVIVTIRGVGYKFDPPAIQGAETSR